MSSTQIVRVALALTADYALSLGVLAAFAPHTFYDDYPFIGHYVALLPPYNEHLVSDVGGLYLGFGVILVWAAWRPERTLVLAASTGFILAAAIHLAFHIGHLSGVGSGDAIGELTGLTLVLVPPAVAIWAVARQREAT